MELENRVVGVGEGLAELSFASEEDDT